MRNLFLQPSYAQLKTLYHLLTAYFVCEIFFIDYTKKIEFKGVNIAHFHSWYIFFKYCYKSSDTNGILFNLFFKQNHFKTICIGVRARHKRYFTHFLIVKLLLHSKERSIDEYFFKRVYYLKNVQILQNNVKLQIMYISVFQISFFCMRI